MVVVVVAVALAVAVAVISNSSNSSSSSSSSSSSRSPAGKKPPKKQKHDDIIQWYHKVSPLGTNNIMMIMTACPK